MLKQTHRANTNRNQPDYRCRPPQRRQLSQASSLVWATSAWTPCPRGRSHPQRWCPLPRWRGMTSPCRWFCWTRKPGEVAVGGLVIGKWRFWFSLSPYLVYHIWTQLVETKMNFLRTHQCDYGNLLVTLIKSTKKKHKRPSERVCYKTTYIC